jgi:hypothetical protein
MVLFRGFGGVFLVVLTPVYPLGLKAIIQMFLPIGYEKYWFMTNYIMLMLMSPVLNFAISNMSKEMHRNLLIGATVLWSILPTFTMAKYGYNILGWFTVLYLFAAYIRKYVDFKKSNAHKHFAVAGSCFFLITISNIVLIYLEHITGVEMFTNQGTKLWIYNSPLTLMTAIELLIGFLKLKPYYNRVVNALASATLGVYLIHDNDVVRPYLWGVLLKNSEMYHSKYLILHAFFSIAIVYFVCTCIDLLRQNTIEKVFLYSVNKHLKKEKDKVESVLKKESKKIYSIMSWIYK